jgi:hypothetical protein
MGLGGGLVVGCNVGGILYVVIYKDQLLWYYAHMNIRKPLTISKIHNCWIRPLKELIQTYEDLTGGADYHTDIVEGVSIQDAKFTLALLEGIDDGERDINALVKKARESVGSPVLHVVGHVSNDELMNEIRRRMIER